MRCVFLIVSFALAGCATTFRVVQPVAEQRYAGDVPAALRGCFWLEETGPRGYYLHLCCPGRDTPDPECRRSRWVGPHIAPPAR